MGGGRGRGAGKPPPPKPIKRPDQSDQKMKIANFLSPETTFRDAPLGVTDAPLLPPAALSSDANSVGSDANVKFSTPQDTPKVARKGPSSVSQSALLDQFLENERHFVQQMEALLGKYVGPLQAHTDAATGYLDCANLYFILIFVMIFSFLCVLNYFIQIFLISDEAKAALSLPPSLISLHTSFLSSCSKSEPDTDSRAKVKLTVSHKPTHPHTCAHIIHSSHTLNAYTHSILFTFLPFLLATSAVWCGFV